MNSNHLQQMKDISSQGTIHKKVWSTLVSPWVNRQEQHTKDMPQVNQTDVDVLQGQENRTCVFNLDDNFYGTCILHV